MKIILRSVFMFVALFGHASSHIGTSARMMQGMSQAAARHTLTGEFRMHRAFHSKILSNDRDVIVYLPPGYEMNARRHYPVLYLQDGQNLFDGATSFIPGKEWRVDETAQSLIMSKAIKPLIIVGIYNTGKERIDEYTPVAAPKYHAGGKADLYGQMLLQELKPFIDHRYRTAKGPGNTGIGGSSLGGLLSLYLGLKYPGVFGKLAIISPSVWWGDRFIIRDVQSLQTRPHIRIWLDTGTKEGDEPEKQIQDARSLRDALISKGWKSGSNLLYFEAPGAAHNEEAWAKRVEPILKYLFGR